MIKTIVVLILLGALGYWMYRHHFGVHHVTRALDDGAISAEVLAGIGKESPMSLFSVKVVTKNGVVTLTGTVPAAQERREIVKIAKKADGVNSVVDDLTVNPKARTGAEFKEDLETTALIKKSLFQEEGLRGLGIHVNVTKGTATLSGEVVSKEQAILAGELAKRVKGVDRVENEIKVKEGALK